MNLFSSFHRRTQEIHWWSYVVAVCLICAQTLLTPHSTTASTIQVETIAQPQLIDVNPSPIRPLALNPTYMVTLGEIIYFSAGDQALGYELWRSDGTALGTHVVKDIIPGPAGSNPNSLVVVGDTLFFLVSSDPKKVELWQSDGTTVGTVRIKELFSVDEITSNYKSPQSLTAVGIDLFFIVYDNTTNVAELWKSDGSEVGTLPLKKFQSPVATELTARPGLLYFVAEDEGGAELWKSDGTTDGTVRIKDIHPGATSSYLVDLTMVGNLLYFSADDGSHGNELWKSDGSEVGTVLVRDITPDTGSTYPIYLTPTGNKLYFTALTAVEEGRTTHEGGPELWQTDGTEAGTFRVKDTHGGTDGLVSALDQSVSNGSTVFFVAQAIGKGFELWKSDGTEVGTMMVKDIYPGYESSHPKKLIIVGSTLFFFANNGSIFGLWKSDGTEAGTVFLHAVNINLSEYGSVVPLGNQIVFNADATENTELWISDGSETGTKAVQDPTLVDSSSLPSSFVALGQTLFFAANDGKAGNELWKSNGTQSSTMRVKDIQPGKGSANPQLFTTVGGNLYFVAEDGTHGAELWTSDGTDVGTRLVKDIVTGSNSSNPSQVTAANSVAYFTANDGISGTELWKSDGTTAGTKIVKDIFNGPQPSNPTSLVMMGNMLFFAADDGKNGRQLWRSDGTEQGTVLVKIVLTNSFAAQPTELTVLNNRLFYVASTANGSRTLWQSDGTEVGTRLVKESTDGIVPGDVQNLTLVQNTLYFAATDRATGTELWKSDGTGKGTILVKDIQTTALPPVFVASSNPTQLTAVGNTLFFQVTLGFNASPQLWKSDGSEGGTVRVLDKNNALPFAEPKILGSALNHLIISADDTSIVSEPALQTGREPWLIDENGTPIRLADFSPGPFGSDPQLATSLHGSLFFAATESSVGRELWSIKVVDLQDVFLPLIRR